MFTGIIERTATLLRVKDRPGGRSLHLQVVEQPGLPPWKPAVVGESMALAGVCLTVVAAGHGAGGGEVAFEVVPETLRRTSLGALEQGEEVNLERALAVGDAFGGHYVTGHIDGLGVVRARRPEGDQVLFEIEAPALIGQVIPKGSVAVDGISLTVIDVDRALGFFSFAAIPHTLERTTLKRRGAGSSVNLETDAFGKWVLHALDGLLASGQGDDRLRRLLEERLPPAGR